MITKAAESLLQKEAGILNAWRTVPKAARALGRASGAIFRGVRKPVRALTSIGVKGVDLAGRGFTAAGKQIVRRPKIALPVAAATIYGAHKFNDNLPAYSAHVEAPNSGITRMTPFLNDITFNNEAYRKYYE